MAMGSRLASCFLFALASLPLVSCQPQATFPLRSNPIPPGFHYGLFTEIYDERGFNPVNKVGQFLVPAPTFEKPFAIRSTVPNHVKIVSDSSAFSLSTFLQIPYDIESLTFKIHVDDSFLMNIGKPTPPANVRA